MTYSRVLHGRMTVCVAPGQLMRHAALVRFLVGMGWRDTRIGEKTGLTAGQVESIRRRAGIAAAARRGRPRGSGDGT